MKYALNKKVKEIFEKNNILFFEIDNEKDEEEKKSKIKNDYLSKKDLENMERYTYSLVFQNINGTEYGISMDVTPDILDSRNKIENILKKINCLDIKKVIRIIEYVNKRKMEYDVIDLIDLKELILSIIKEEFDYINYKQYEEFETSINIEGHYAPYIPSEVFLSYAKDILNPDEYDNYGFNENTVLYGSSDYTNRLMCFSSDDMEYFEIKPYKQFDIIEKSIESLIVMAEQYDEGQ